MSWFLRTVSSVFSTAFDFDTVSSAFDVNKATLSGALDVVAVQHEDGTFKSTPFHVRFGKLKVFRYKNKKVKLFVNGKDVGIMMKLGEAGEAYFIVEIPQHQSRSSEEAMSTSAESYTNQIDCSHTSNNIHSTQSSPIASSRELDTSREERHTAPVSNVGAESRHLGVSPSMVPSNGDENQQIDTIRMQDHLLPPLLEAEADYPASPVRTWHWGWGHLPRRKGSTRKRKQQRKTLMIPLEQNLYVSKVSRRCKISRRHSTGHAIDPVDIGVADVTSSSGHSNTYSERLYGDLYEVDTPYKAETNFLKLKTSKFIRTSRTRSSSVDLSDHNAGAVSSSWSPVGASATSLVGIPFAVPSLRASGGDIRMKKTGKYPWGLLAQSESADRPVPLVSPTIRIPWIIQQWTQSPWRAKLNKDKAEVVPSSRDKEDGNVELSFVCTTCKSKNRIVLDVQELSALRRRAEELLSDYSPSTGYIGIGSPLSCSPSPWFASIEALTAWYPSLVSTTTCYDSIEVSRCGNNVAQFETYKCFAVDTFPYLKQFLLSIRQPASICLRFSVRLRSENEELAVTLYTSYFVGTQLILFNILRSQAAERLSTGELSVDHDVHRSTVTGGNTSNVEKGDWSSPEYEPKSSRSQRFFRWLGKWISSTPRASATTESSVTEAGNQHKHDSDEYNVRVPARAPVFSVCRQCLGVQRVSVPTGVTHSRRSSVTGTRGVDQNVSSKVDDSPVEADEEWSKKKGWKSILGGGYSRRRARRLKHQQTQLSSIDDHVDDIPEQLPEDVWNADTSFEGRGRSLSTAVSFAAEPQMEVRGKPSGSRRKSLPSVLPLTWSAREDGPTVGPPSSSHPISAPPKHMHSSSATTGGTSRSRARSIFSYIWGGQSSRERDDGPNAIPTDGASAYHLPSRAERDVERASSRVDVIDSPKSERYDSYEQGVKAALEDTDALQQTLRAQIQNRERSEPENASNVSVSEETVQDDSDSENVDTNDPDTKKVRRIYPTSDMLERMELLNGPNLLTFVVCQSAEETESDEGREAAQQDQATVASSTENIPSTAARTRSFSDMGAPLKVANAAEEAAPMSAERRHSFSESRPSFDEVRGDFLAEANEAVDSASSEEDNPESFGKDLAAYNGFVSVSCTLYLWEPDAKVVVSDVDGTITRSDLWGHIMYYLPIQDWTHPGVAELFANISKNGYHMMYLTSRAIGQIEDTKSYLFNVTQKRSSVSPREPSKSAADLPKKEKKKEADLAAYSDDPLGIGGLARTDSVKGSLEKKSSDKKPPDKQAPPGPEVDKAETAERIQESSASSRTLEDPKLNTEIVAQNTESKRTMYERLKEEFHSQRARYLERAGSFPSYRHHNPTDTASRQSVTLPPGPVITSPDRLFDAVKREVILRKPQEFKISALSDIKRLFGTNKFPFYAGFGNRDTDVIAYKQVGIREGKIFIINPKGEIHAAGDARRFKTSYWSLNSLVDTVFPKISPSGTTATVERVDAIEASSSVGSTSAEGEVSEATHPLGSRHGRPVALDEEYNDLNYWRLNPIPIIESDEEESQDSNSTSDSYQSAGEDDAIAELQHSPYRSGGKALVSQTENSWRHSEVNPLRLQSASPAERPKHDLKVSHERTETNTGSDNV
eukprot:gb/GECG01001137.1/.p1 GENE.gb/GECG01001137.1/~~gb/GECG01001137.1/.p1  ORF type:complete len:1629 (+),score=220.09 gb/GECG01001137.1/:1-4887(+)